MANAFGSTPNASLEAALQLGASKANAAVGAANAGLGAVQGFTNAMRGDAASMRNQARLVNTEAGKVGEEADALKALIPQLDPYKDKLTNYGDTLAALATQSQSRADDVFGQAAALSSLDPNATGQAAEYMKHYNLLSPDRYVSRAASDVQSSFSNAVGQMDRDNSRRGASAGSGASLSLRQQLGRALATTLAAAKTKARQMGIDEQGSWLKEMTSAAKTFYDMGTEQQAQSMTALGQAGDMAKGAAGIVAQQGDMTKNVGAMRAEVASLYSNAASIFGNAAGVEGSAGNLTLNAYKALIDANYNAAKYYVDAAATEVSANNGGSARGSSGGGAVSSSGSSGDSDATGAWVDLTHGKASHADGAQWIWDANAPAAPAGE